MAFTTPKTGGGTATLGRLGKFVVGGETVLITGIGGCGNGIRTRRKPPGATPDTYYPFSQLNPTTLAPEWGAGVSVEVQYKADTEERSQLVNADDGPGMPETYLIGYLLDADGTSRCPHIRLVLQDVHRALMDPGLYTIKLLPPPIVADPGDPELSIPPTTTEAVPIVLVAVRVDLREQWVSEGNARRKLGDAKLTISCEGLSLDNLLAEGAFITVAAAGINSGVARRYQVTGPEGIDLLQTYHACVYLKRIS